MEGNKEDIIKFAEAFFNNLKSELVWEGEILSVKNVPADFEDFFGKKAPYHLSFEAGSDPNTEFMSKGSFLLKAMTSYLENRGQTTLIKLNFERNYKEEFEKYLKLKNCELYSLTKKINNKMIISFTFMTTFQYLNEKEQLMNSISVEDGKVINFNLEKYTSLEGKKEDIQKKDYKLDYESAKEELKKMLQVKVQETSSSLKKRLDKEIERVKEHYKHQIKEIDDNIVRYRDQITNLQKQLSKAEKSEEKEMISAKIEKLNETIKLLENTEKRNKFIQEEKFFVNDETHKHTLNINNKLMNTTLIYYPVFDFTLFFKSKDSARQFELVYNPMLDTLTSINCEVCKRSITELSICSSGHINCQNCSDKCRSCYSNLCANCLKKDCDFCGIKLCKKCAIKCNKCWKFVCKSHLRQDYVTGKEYCSNCLIRCQVCNKFTTDANINKDNSGREICKKCSSLAAIRASYS